MSELQSQLIRAALRGSTHEIRKVKRQIERNEVTRTFNEYARPRNRGPTLFFSLDRLFVTLQEIWKG
jgi:hypothetical protein